MNAQLLRKLDLNLLVAFVVLMRERHVSRAARKLAIGQSGLSGVLARLRATFDDPLLVRVGRDFQPTPRALELIGPVEQALELIEWSTSRKDVFQPQSSDRTFSLGMTDDHELLFGPEVVAALRRAAPRARLVMRPLDAAGLRGALDEASLDVALSVLHDADMPAWHARQQLFHEGFACVWSPKRLRIAPRLTMERFTAAPHVLVTLRGELTGFVDDALQAIGRRRDVVLGVPRFTTLPAVLAAIPALSTVPALLASYFARQHRLATAPLPLAIPARDFGLVYRRRDAELVDLAWFRDLVAQSVRTVLGGPPR
jgi:DNA-binding transcriptional LysR family regulator